MTNVSSFIYVVSGNRLAHESTQCPSCDSLYHVSFRRYSPLRLEVVEKQSKYESFLAPNFCRTDISDFSTAVC